MLNPTGDVTRRLKSNLYNNQAQNTILSFENILIQESITSLFLQRLLINQDEVLIQFFNSERINKSTLTKLRDQYHLTLKETQSPNHWNKYRISEIAANMVYELIDSQTFRNIFENVVRNRGENVSMENLIKIIIPLVNKEYEKFAQQYKTENWETLKCSIQTMKHMTRFPTYVERLQQLIEVVLMFKVLCTKGGWLSTMLMILENEYLWLGVLNAEYNIKNLINSVDDQSDERLIQEEAMSSLIQVHQVLVPVIKSDETLTVKRLLRKLALIVETNPKLGQKIELCNCNRKVLKNLVKNITEITQERISNFVKKGSLLLNEDLIKMLKESDKMEDLLDELNVALEECSDKPSIRNIKPVDKPPRPRRGRDRNFGHNFDY
ncbi:hypothetical protein C2G38_2168271 [Gigaspora rosea]|uniref:Uncharacterized protein n=1 Tax=Gigaspora rosea TaxID=44941 RepID=A0A397VU84_9GLOM|nr:hypothetical protein C2G38_2168271 [Gigaspora rosea]